MLTLLFDGIAYGMLLFVLAVRPGRDDGADELHQPRARRLRDGGRLRHRAADEAARRAVPGLPAGRLPRRGAARRGARAHAVPAACTSAAAPRPGAVLDRPDLHGGGGGRLLHRLARSRTSSCPTGCGAASRSSGVGIGSYRLFIIVVCVALALGAAVGPVAHPLRQPAARRGRRPARGRAAWASTSTAIFLLTFALGSGLAGLGGALGVEVLGLDPTFPLKFMIYFLIVVRGRRHHLHHRPAARRAAARHRRRGRQVLRAQARRLHRLRADDRDPDAAAAGPVRASAGDDASSHASLGAGLRAARARWRWLGIRALARCRRCRASCCRRTRCCSTRSRSSRCSRCRST